MAEKLDPETKRLRALLPSDLADEAGAAKARLESVKEEAIRRGLHRAQGECWKISLSPPSESNRTDKALLLKTLGISESEYTARFTNPVHTDWVMRCSPLKAPRVTAP
jgi:hypothetical protein